MAAREKVEFVISARDRTRSALRGVRRGFARLGRLAATGLAAIAAGVGAIAVSSEKLVRRLEVLSLQLGDSVENLDALRQASAAAGVEFDTVVGGLEEIRTRAGEAILGNEDLAKAFGRVGISIDQLKTENLLQTLLRLAAVAQTLSQRGQFSELTALLDEIGGGELTRALPILTQGPEALASALQNAARFTPENFQRVSQTGRFARATIAGGQSAAINVTGEGIQLAKDTAKATAETASLLRAQLSELSEINRKTEETTFGVFGP